jgi:hypothetical protein
MIFITSFILCLDAFATENLMSFFSHLTHCIVEGIIVLMFSRELRGDLY